MKIEGRETKQQDKSEESDREVDITNDLKKFAKFDIRVGRIVKCYPFNKKWHFRIQIKRDDFITVLQELRGIPRDKFMEGKVLIANNIV